jgi:hypothetical protein
VYLISIRFTHGYVDGALRKYEQAPIFFSLVNIRVAL